MRPDLARSLFAGLLLVTTVMLLTPPQGPSSGAVDDKVGHLLAFAVLALAGRWARVPAIPLLLGLAAYAGATEVLQSLLPVNRHGDPQDLLADLVGLVVGLGAGVLLTRLARREEPSPSRPPG